MEIKYQTVLNNNPVIKSTVEMANGLISFFTLKPLTIDEIVHLETTYNNSNQFPTSLRELLFLAGQDCYVLDYGLTDTQEEMQNDAREWLVDYGFSITRPFFVIDVHRGSDIFLFVYTDEGINDPIVYEANLDKNLPSGYSWLKNLQASLSSFVNARISYLQRGINPF
ncbi:hypothetical protein [Mucilaginibacter aquaedulcis]|uniref:hypothetical protein n=1 Tax=Mucilaginibacter aquaedulcis TaxID=1187081 RepID=UPI0025B5DFB6|nr:hypothetical protein [Mucilaginibacter aquaedulcis]MDN3548801.1 hypothetical protein [Mucilaginibacter aquaedulcis]